VTPAGVRTASVCGQLLLTVMSVKTG
jgi:hypothetical protein